MSQVPVEKIPLDKQRQAHVIAYFRVNTIYRSDTARELDRLHGLDGTPLSDEQTKQLHGYRLGYGSTQAESVMPVFIKLEGKVGHFCGIRMDEVPNDKRGYVQRTIRDGWLQTYDHEDVTVVEPSMLLADAAFFIKKELPVNS